MGSRLGNRLQRFSKDTGIWIDAFESDQRHPSLQKEKNAKCTIKPWTDEERVLGKAKFTDMAIFSPSAVCDVPSTIYQLSALALRAQGKLFVGDLMWADTSNRPGDGSLKFLSKSEHMRALSAAGFRFCEDLEISKDLIGKIKQSLLAMAEIIRDLGKVEERDRKAVREALGGELETWGKVGLLAEAGHLTLACLVVAKA